MRLQVSFTLSPTESGAHILMTVEIYRDEQGTLGFMAYAHVAGSRKQYPAILTESDLVLVKAKFAAYEAKIRTDMIRTIR